MWLAPNLITLIGTFCAAGGSALVAYHLPGLQGSAPAYVYLINFLCSLIYMHLDCVDGKQARRTNSSNPLGQLFDHGCDAINVFFQISAALAVMGVGYSHHSILCFATGALTFVIPHIAEYHTGNFSYGNGYVGLTEAMYAVALISGLTAWWGPAFWTRPVSTLPLVSTFFPALYRLLASGSSVTMMMMRKMIPFLSFLRFPNVVDYTVADAMMTMMMVMGVINIASDLVPMFSSRGSTLSRADRGHKTTGRVAAWQHTMFFVFLHVLCLTMMFQSGGAVHAASTATPTATATASMSTRMSKLTSATTTTTTTKVSAQGLRTLRRSVADTVSLLCFATYGTTIALQATRFIAAHMAKSPFHVDTISLLAVGLNVVNAYGFQYRFASPMTAGWLSLGLVVVTYAHYAITSIHEICEGLGISAFVLTRRGGTGGGGTGGGDGRKNTAKKKTPKKTPKTPAQATPKKTTTTPSSAKSARMTRTPSRSRAGSTPKRTPTKSPGRLRTPAR